MQRGQLLAGGVQQAGGVQYSSFLDAMQKTFRGEGGGTAGVRALYRGALARVMFHVPNTAISMALFEESRKWWAKVL